MTAIPATFRLRREGALRSRAARGDAAAFAAVYERHHLALYRYCRSILRHEEDAQDALQSTFTRAFAALQDERRDFDLKPWLFRIAHNEAISTLRRRQATDELADVPDARPFEDRIVEREELRLLALDLADLPERQRAALVLRELNGLSHAEIGLVLELSPSAVKQSIFEARSALFSCREGREMDCQAIRRVLSDGDGRVLRGRGVRAHLRSCDGCKRFREDLDQRPKALHALVPPLPVGAAGALLAEILGGATAAKLLACVAVAGGGATLAVELRDVRSSPPPAAAEAVPTATPERTPRPSSTPPPVVVPPVTTSERQREPEPTAAPKKPKAAPKPERKPRARTPDTSTTPAAKATPPATPKPPEKRVKPDKPPRPEKPDMPDKPPRPEKPDKPPKALPPQAQQRGQGKPPEKATGRPEHAEQQSQSRGNSEQARAHAPGQNKQAEPPAAPKQPSGEPGNDGRGHAHGRGGGKDD